MLGKKVYLLMKVTVPPQLVQEFNEYWRRESLPLLLKHGAKLIGAFENYVGGPTHEEFRLLEFENIAQWQQFEEGREKIAERRDHRDKLVSRFHVTVERRLLTAIYDDVP